VTVEPLPLGVEPPWGIAATPAPDTNGHGPTHLPEEGSSGAIGHTEQVARYQWVAQLASGRDVLDAGCGAAYGTRMLVASGARRVVGVDRSAEAIAHATVRAPELELVTAELAELPLPSASFDLAVSFAAPPDPRAALGELRRVLRPDGCAIVCFDALAAKPLEALVLSVFGSCQIVSQRLWAATVIGEHPALTPVPDIGAPGQSTVALAIASGGKLPRLEGLAALAHTQELELWRRRLDDAREDLHATRQQLATSRAREEDEAGRARQSALALEAISRDSAELLSAQQRIFGLEEELLMAGLELRQLGELMNSRSWRLTSPFRATMRLLRR
jgi:SAM-dependent methyltransferase